MTECGCQKKGTECQRCKKEFCDKHIFSKVDGSNRSITKNALLYCEDCYKIIYGKDWY